MEAPICRLYLIAPDPLPADFANMLRAALAAGDVAALRLTTADEAVIAMVRPVTRAFGVALILHGPPALAVSALCDGVHVDGADAAQSARRALGDLQLGVFCGQSRDEAMRAGEAGADYVAFGPVGDLGGDRGDGSGGDGAETVEAAISWWADLMELPVVAEGGITVANCAALVRAGADFLAAGETVWHDPAGPAAAVRALEAAIAANRPAV